MNMKKLSIIVPVYNEEATIREVLETIRTVEIADMEREIIVVDDGSNDESTRLIKEAEQEYPNLIRTYVSPINLGKGAAVRMGLKYATGDIIIFQDSDLELDPNEYLNLLKPILEGKTKVVYGSRFRAKHDKQIPRKTIWSNRFLTFLTNVLYRSRLTDMETAYKVFTKDAISEIRLRCAGFDIEPEITARLLQNRFKIIEVPITYNPRTIREGKKIGFRDGLDAIWTLVMCKLCPLPEK